MALESVSDKAFDPATNEYVLTQFKSIANKLINYWSKVSKDKEFDKIPLFRDEIENFIKEISWY